MWKRWSVQSWADLGNWSGGRCVLLLLLLAGCSSEPPPGVGGASASDTVLAEPVTAIGELEGAPEYTFGRVSSVAIGPGDIVYVADRITSDLRAYGLDGHHIALVGSEGDGPGEFSCPCELSFSPDGRLFVRDAVRLTVLGSRDGSSVADSVIGTIQLPGYPNLSATRATADNTAYYYPDNLFRRGEPEEYFYLKFDSAGPTGDTIRVPPLRNLEHTREALVRTGRSGGRILRGLNRAPFEPRASWTITRAGTVIATEGDSDMLVEYGPTGDTLRVIHGGGGIRSVPRGEADDSLRAFRQRLDSVPVPLDKVEGMSDAARSGELPSVLPSILSVHTSDDGDLWIRRWPPEGVRHTTYFDVLDGQGRKVATVRVPATLETDPPPYFGRGLIAGVMRDPETDVESVMVFRVRVGAGAR